MKKMIYLFIFLLANKCQLPEYPGSGGKSMNNKKNKKKNCETHYRGKGYLLLAISLYLNISISMYLYLLGGAILKKCFQKISPDPYITLYICKTENPGV